MQLLKKARNEAICSKCKKKKMKRETLLRGKYLNVNSGCWQKGL